MFSLPTLGPKLLPNGPMGASHRPPSAPQWGQFSNLNVTFGSRQAANVQKRDFDDPSIVFAWFSLPRTPPNRPIWSPKCSQIAPERLPSTPKWPPIAPSGPKWPQNCPKWHQNGTKWLQVPPKEHQNGTKIVSIGTEMAPSGPKIVPSCKFSPKNDLKSIGK